MASSFHHRKSVHYVMSSKKLTFKWSWRRWEFELIENIFMCLLSAYTINLFNSSVIQNFIFYWLTQIHIVHASHSHDQFITSCDKSEKEKILRGENCRKFNFPHKNLSWGIAFWSVSSFQFVPIHLLGAANDCLLSEILISMEVNLETVDLGYEYSKILFPSFVFSIFHW